MIKKIGWNKNWVKLNLLKRSLSSKAIGFKNPYFVWVLKINFSSLSLLFYLKTGLQEIEMVFLL